MKKPLYQILIEKAYFIIGGMLALGGFIGAINDASQRIDYRIAIFITVPLAITWFCVERFLRQRRIHWHTEDGIPISIAQLCNPIRLGLIGCIALIWIAAFFHVKEATNQIVPAQTTINAPTNNILVTNDNSTTSNVSVTTDSSTTVVSTTNIYSPLYIAQPISPISIQEKADVDIVKPASDDETLLIISKFDNRSEGGIPPGVDPSSYIYDFLLEKIVDSKIRVVRLTEALADSEAAKTMGREKHATLVIWGYYDSLRVQPYVELIDRSTLLGHAADISTPTPVAFYFREQAPQEAAYLGLYSLGLTYIDTSSQSKLTQAVSYFKAALDIKIGWEALMWRGNCYWWLGENQLAIADFNEALRLHPHKEGYNNRGIAYGALGEQQKAIDDYTKALEIDGAYVNAYLGRGNAYGALGEQQKAIDDFTRAIAIDGKSAGAYWGRGYAYGALGEQQNAIDDFTRAIAIDGKFAGAYVSRGNAYRALGEQQKAIEDYTRAIESDGSYALAYANRGTAYKILWKQGEPTKDLAIADFEHVLELIDDPQWRKNTEKDLGELRGK